MPSLCTYFISISHYFSSWQVTAAKLGEFFMNHATVVEAKIILDRDFQSKRYGFVTLGKKENAEKILKRKIFVINGKRINVGPAIKKQVSSLLLI